MTFVLSLVFLTSFFGETAFSAFSSKKATKKSGKKSRQLVKANSPGAYLDAQILRLSTEIRARPPHLSAEPTDNVTETVTDTALVVSSGSKKSDWLAVIYAKKLVEASDITEAMADKLTLYSLIKSFLGSETETYLIKTIGLKQFLESNKFVGTDGKITGDGEAIDAALHKEFPAGFVVRPAVGIVSTETELGLFRDSDQFIIEILKPKNSLYEPATFHLPIRSHILNAISSGEAVVLQDNVLRVADAEKLLKRHHAFKIRFHTYEGQIIPDSSPRRWVREDVDDFSPIRKEAEKFAQNFLDRLPRDFLVRQAWSIEVSGFDNGVLRITDILTNRGQKISWSSYLDQPRILQAYTNYFELHENVEFGGFSGWLLRHGWANYFTFWNIRLEKAQGWHKALAIFPPWP